MFRDTSFIEKKYLDVISSRLDRFVWKTENLANCRCPVCGDSETNTRKARGFFIKKNVSEGDFWYYLCHNCGYSLRFSRFLKEHFSEYYSGFLAEAYLKKERPLVVENKIKIDKPVFDTSLKWDYLSNIESLSVGDPHRSYLLSRGITEAYWKRLFYTNDYQAMVSQYSLTEALKIRKSEKRIILPLYSQEKTLFGFVGRTIEDNKERYLTIKLDHDHTKVFGLETLDTTKTVYVLEGPIDSLFIPNSIAACGTYLSPQYIKSISKNSIVVLDNQPRNSNVVYMMMRYASAGLRVVVWKNISPALKDINDMIMSGMKPNEIIGLMEENTFSGLKAKNEIQHWKRN